MITAQPVCNHCLGRGYNEPFGDYETCAYCDGTGFPPKEEPGPVEYPKLRLVIERD